MRRLLATAAAITTLFAVTPPPAAALATFTMERVAGDSRYATAAELAIDTFGTSSGVIIATGEQFPDALAASFIAGYVNSPILLVERDRVPDATLDALTTLETKEIVLLGGTAAISQGVEDELSATYDVVRLYGPDRFATAANIALAVNPGDIGELDGHRTAFLTYGYSFADAMAIGPLSFAGRFPILLNGSGALGTPARIAIDRLDITHVVIVGGVISEAAVDEIEDMDVTTERVAGADRFATAADVATFALERLDFVPDHVNLARGYDPRDPRGGFADALAGSVHAGHEQAPLLLTHPTALSAPTHAWLEDHAETLAAGDVLGGEGAVAPSVVDVAVADAQRVSGFVTEVFKEAHEYTYEPEDADDAITITYEPEDTFTIDGELATMDAFEAALSTGDRIRATTAGGITHRLEDLRTN